MCLFLVLKRVIIQKSQRPNGVPIIVNSPRRPSAVFILFTIRSMYYSGNSPWTPPTSPTDTDIGSQVVPIVILVTSRTSIQEVWEIIPLQIPCPSDNGLISTMIYRNQNNQIIGAKPIRTNRPNIIIFITPLMFIFLGG